MSMGKRSAKGTKHPAVRTRRRRRERRRKQAEIRAVYTERQRAVEAARQAELQAAARELQGQPRHRPLTRLLAGALLVAAVVGTGALVIAMLTVAS